MGKKRPKKKTKNKPTKAERGSPKTRRSREQVTPPETRDVGADLETPQWLLPPRVEWLDDIHKQRTRAPKRIQRRMERIAKMVWRNIPDRERTVIDLLPRDIFLVSGPVGKVPPEGHLDDVGNRACWQENLGILINVEGEASDPMAEKRFTFAVAHELAHAYLKSAELLIYSWAASVPDTRPAYEERLQQLKAVAAAYGPGGKTNRGAEEVMVTALAISWGFGPEYLTTWLATREGKA